MSMFEDVQARIRAATTRWMSGVSLAEIRQEFEALVGGEEPPLPDMFTHAGMPAAWFGGRADRAAPRAVLFCHGGGFQIGSLLSHRGLMAQLADAASTPVLGFEYRRAPEARFPAAHDDAVQAYVQLLNDLGETARIAIAGDSAGGNLALATALRADRAGLRKPDCLVLISPWLDLAMRGDSYRTRAELDFFSKPEQLRAMARTYLGRGGNPTDPACTPLHDDLKGLPPTLVHAGDHDITLDDSTALSARAAQSDVNLRLRVWPGMFHHFQIFDELDEAQQSINEIGAFLRDHLHR
jgi:monoterpene epsilon-lactone hydrolase